VSGDNVLVTRTSVHVPIRSIGNSRAIVIPESFLAQAGIETTAELSIERGAIVLRKSAAKVRAGWAEAAQLLAARGGDVLVMGEFANGDDTERYPTRQPIASGLSE
jgi:antitoxin MazE